MFLRVIKNHWEPLSGTPNNEQNTKIYEEMTSFDGGTEKVGTAAPVETMKSIYLSAHMTKQLQALKQIYEKVLEYQEKANAAIFTDYGILSTKYLS